MLKIHPTASRVLLETSEPEAITKSGIILPDSAKDKRKSTIGTVVAVGPDITGIMVGDKVLYAEYGFEPVEVEGKKYQIGLEENVLAIIENEPLPV